MPRIYLDMDGVLADFNTKAMEILGAAQEDSDAAAQRGRWPREQWEQLRQIGNFYRILPKTSIADRIVELGCRFRDELGWELYVLTAIPSGNDSPEAFHDKIDWMAEHYPEIRVRFGPYSKDKHLHCQPGDVLVDDRWDNYQDWNRAGGHCVKVNSWDLEQAVKDLDLLFTTQQQLHQAGKK